MKDSEDKEKFIELRAQGLSFAKISDKIGVSKPILMRWNNDFQKEISNSSFLVAEELLEKYQLMKASRVKMFAELLSRALQELEAREFKLCSSKELLNFIKFFDSRLKSEAASINCITDNPSWDLLEDMEVIKIPLID